MDKFLAGYEFHLAFLGGGLRFFRYHAPPPPLEQITLKYNYRAGMNICFKELLEENFFQNIVAKNRMKKKLHFCSLFSESTNKFLKFN